MADTRGWLRHTMRPAVVGTMIATLLAAGVPASAAQTPPTIAGTVVETGSSTPIGGAFVAALRSTDFSVARATVAATDGTYAITGVPAGSYFLYLVDPTGGHTAALAPGPVSVGASGTTAVDPTMTPLRGAIAGTITEDGTGDPVAGAWVAALSTTTGELERADVADGSGSFRIDDLAPGGHRLITIDPTGAHAPEFYDNRPGPAGAGQVAVTAGAATPVTAALTPTTAPAGATGLTGTITDAASNSPIAGAWVVALHQSTMGLAAGTLTAADGTYDLGLDPGEYLVEFVDPTGGHSVEWHDNLPANGLGAATPVSLSTGPPATISAALPPTTGSLRGTAIEDFSGDPVPGAWVLAIGPTSLFGTTTAIDGTYSFGSLPTGTYRSVFVDVTGARAVEYLDGATDYAGATPFTVAAGQAVTRNISLTPHLCPATAAPPTCIPAYPRPTAGAGWSKYTIAPGAHSATVTRGSSATQPLANFTTVSRRRFHFLFNATARYVLTNPTQPEDQFDWNKLPGISDCGDIDLSQNGLMFGWRWRTDLTPRVLEVTAYANNNGVHLTPVQPMLTLTQAQVDAQVPLWFDVGISSDGQRYEFRINGPGTRAANTTLPRACPSTGLTAFKWAAGFYFGGTSTAPNTITGWINEP